MKVVRDVKDRSGIIGCSQLGSLLNVSTYGTPFTVYKDYIGEGEHQFSEVQIESMAMGNFFEDPIAQFAAKKFGVRIRRSNKAYVHKKIPQFICHPDRLVIGKVDGLRVGFEIKHVQPFASGWGEPDTNEVPDGYHLQSLGYIACNVCDVVWLFVMKGNRIFRYIITKDYALIEMIESAIIEFVAKVESGFEYLPNTYALVQSEYEMETPLKEVMADEMTEYFVKSHFECDGDIKKLNKKVDGFKTEIGLFMKDAELLLSENGDKLVTFKTDKGKSKRTMRFSRRK